MRKRKPKRPACELCGLPIDPVTYPRHPSHDLPDEQPPDPIEIDPEGPTS